MDRKTSTRYRSGRGGTPHSHGGYPIGMEFDQWSDGRQRYEYDDHPLWRDSYVWDKPMGDIQYCDDEDYKGKHKRRRKKEDNGERGGDKQQGRHDYVPPVLAIGLDEEDEPEEEDWVYEHIEKPYEEPYPQLPRHRSVAVSLLLHASL